MTILLKNAWIVRPEETVTADLRLAGEKIAAIGQLAGEAGETVIDCTGKYLLPGGIETHTHLQLEGMKTVTKDDFYTGTRAALAGGTTTVIDFATQFHGESMAQGLANWRRKSEGRCFIDYAFHMAVTEWNDDLRQEMEEMVEQGITSFKMYMAYRNNMMVQEDAIFDALSEARRLGVTIGFHCENGFLIDALIAKEKAAGHLGPYYHQVCRPENLEAEAVTRLAATAELAGGHCYVVHLSSALGLEAIRRARLEGCQMGAETCPQYLVLDKSRYGQPDDEDFSAAKYIMSPPLRDKKNQAALWNALADGDIQFVGTDHCSFDYVGQKEMGRADFTKIPNGGPGIETRMILLYSYGVAEGRMSINRYSAVTATNAARFFGLYPQKGILLPGSDADIILLNPDVQTTIEKAGLHENNDYSPYEGLPVKGKIERVFLRGTERVRDGEILSTAEADGRFLKRHLPDVTVR